MGGPSIADCGSVLAGSAGLLDVGHLRNPVRPVAVENVEMDRQRAAERLVRGLAQEISVASQWGGPSASI